MSMHAAARVTDTFGHDAKLEGIAAGIAVGAMIGIGIIATGGLGAVAVAAAVATTGSAALAGAAIGRGFDGPTTGMLELGSGNVLINLLPATMVEQAIGTCRRHGASPQRVATGSATVFINGHPAARVSEKMDCDAQIRTGSRNVFIGGRRHSPICNALFGENAQFDRFRIEAQAASAAYDAPEDRKPPEGHRNATAADLEKLHLDPGMLEHPVDPDTKEPSDFRAAVFIDERTGAPLIAYKGTTGLSDWKVNFQQGLGKETFYYTHAQRIARRVANSPGGAQARLVGHSLGGGMASAGSRASGLPATTFNAAGLHAKTVPHPVDAPIDAVYVRGEALRASQAIPGMPRSAETQAWPLDPAGPPAAFGALMAARAGPYAVGGYLAARSVKLHFMDAVDAAIAKRQQQIAKAFADNGCG